jgi:NAD+ synthetase
MKNGSIKIFQMNVVPGKIQKNAKKMLDLSEKSRTQKVQTVVFPACALTGFTLGNYIHHEEFWLEADYWRQKIIAASNEMTIIWGDATIQGEHLSEFPCIAINGTLLNSANSTFTLPNSNLETLHILTGDAPLPQEKSDLIIRLAHHIYQKESLFSPAAESESLATTPYIYLNPVGIEDHGGFVNLYTGGSGLKNGSGYFNRALPYFEEESLDFCLDTHNESSALPEPEKMEILYQALRHGAKYFLEHIGVSKVVIGLSGGIDSMMSACIYRSILPPENLLLVNMPSRFNSNTTKGIANHIATKLEAWYGVMPIEEAVQSTLSQFNSTYFERPDSAPLTLELSTLNVENLQARVRSNRILATLSSAFGGVFTCNGNKSEFIVGYGTLYGDDAGFFSLLGDLWKTEIYELAHYLKKHSFLGEAIPDEIFTTPPSAELSENQDVEKGLGDPIQYHYHDRLFAAFVERMPNATPLTLLNWYQAGILEKNLDIPQGTLASLFNTPKEFINDMERWWKLFTGLSAAKRNQGSPNLALSKRAFGAFSENQISWVPSTAYLEVKKSILE